MKIRSGFVSNSSSSSFCILGVEVDSDIYEKVRSVRYSKENPTNLESHGSISYEGSYYVGFSPDKMKDDETLGQFKERIVTETNKFGLTVQTKSLDWITDGGYNG